MITNNTNGGQGKKERRYIAGTLPTLAAIALIAMCSVGSAHAQGTINQIRFEGKQAPGENAGYTFHWEGPIQFRGSFALAGPPLDEEWPDNGTGHMLAGGGDHLVINYVFPYGQRDIPFTPLSVDLAEFSTVYAEPRSIPFIGLRPDGSTVTQFFVLDGIIDGRGPIPDYQTFYFGPEFMGVVRLEVPLHRWAMDNFVVSNIPEPSTSALLLIATAALATRRRLARNQTGKRGIHEHVR